MMDKIRNLFEKKRHDAIFNLIEQGLTNRELVMLCEQASRYNDISVFNFILSYNMHLPHEVFVFYCKTGNQQLIQKYLDKNPNVPITDAHCIASIQSGQSDTVRFIIGLSQSRPTKKWFNMAFRYGNREIVEYLLEISCEELVINDETITYACFSGNSSIIEFLLDRNIDTEYVEQLVRVACLCKFKDIVALIIASPYKNKIDIHKTTSVYKSLPMICCQYGYVDIFDILIHAYQDIDVVECFMQSHENRQREMREYIIKHLIAHNEFPLFKKCCDIVDTVYFYTMCKQYTQENTPYATYLDQQIKRTVSFSQCEY